MIKLMLYKKGINSIEGLGTFILSLGQHAGLRILVSRQLQLHSRSIFMGHGLMGHVSPLQHDAI